MWHQGIFIFSERTLEAQQAGEHSLSWDGRDDYGREVASGVYIYRLDVGEWAVHRRMLLLR